MQKTRGFTLLEVLFSMGIMLILATLIIPGSTTLLIRSRITADVNETSALLRLARQHTAEYQGSSVICPSNDTIRCDKNWNLPKMVFADINNNSQRDNNEPLLASSVSNQRVRVSGPINPIRFYADGAISTPATLLFCPDNLEHVYARALVINLQGRIRTSLDSNGDGRHETGTGQPLHCAS